MDWIPRIRVTYHSPIALLLLGSAIFFWGCGSATQSTSTEESTTRQVMTQQSEDLTMLYSQQGNRSYRFRTPLLERYDVAQEPYMEFRRGVEVQTYNDSTHQEDSRLTANYAIFLIDRELWEAKGNVVVINASGQRLETEQLFWDQKSKRIYSNVDSRLTQGTDVIVGEGFESDENFEEYSFRRPKGRAWVEADALTDSTNRAAPAAGSDTAAAAKPATPPPASTPPPPTPPVGEGASGEVSAAQPITPKRTK